MNLKEKTHFLEDQVIATKRVLKEEDKPIVNVPKLLRRLQEITNYKES